ncbi:unnamed protein product [Rhizoctonia solani]|uniref:Uncharacterized protein n=1 Tax=Rhizoctonia solani TaxID=456999 RepID=A0A8H7H2T9_9AGAM|nr:uncharacterized protein RhiXN_02480 [Rhizoctonia solani]KAF8672235.1 hypothetical protein RHS04_07823 [Rhizoctonia solani]QRW17556.1 hypothetical protein RhiXN_02480 [Rhizoctonia solani]CAE6497287.1 unnamed protein product [Rhizoctonia solani]
MDDNQQLSEEQVMNGFHAFLVSALRHAKVERLLDDELLASAEADLMICGPALCLYFAALRSNTNPPGVPLPRPRGSDEPQKRLTAITCPPGFLPFFELWARAVPKIQSLAPEHTYDLASIICGKAPVTLPADIPSPFPESPTAEQTILSKVHAIAADLRAVAIEISQRRSFQVRYQEDLQAALNLGDPTSPGGPRTVPATAKFVPPPGYEEAASASPHSAVLCGKISEPSVYTSVPSSKAPSYGYGLGMPASPPLNSRQSSTDRRYAELPPLPPGTPEAGQEPFVGGFAPPGSPRTPISGGGGFGSPNGESMPGGWAPLRVPQRSSTPTPSRPNTAYGHRATQSATLPVPGSSSIPRPASPSLLTANDPAITIIRETLYAGLADALVEAPELLDLLETDPTRTYFAAVGLAILNVSLTSVTPRGSIRAVLGQELTLEACPQPLRPLMMEFAAIGESAKEIAEEDDRRAMHLAERGMDIPEPRIDRLKRTLQTGVAAQRQEERAARRNTRRLARERERGRSIHHQEEGEDTSGSDEGRQSPSSSTVRFANRLNELALRMTSLPTFKQRQQEVFSILKGVRA